MKAAKIVFFLVGGLILSALVSAILMERVPPAKIGVKQTQWGGSGVVERDYDTGFHLGITGIHKWYLLDKTTHFLTFSDKRGGRGRGQERPSLGIRTRDNNTANVDVSVTYKIKEGEGHLLVKNALRDVYRDRVMTTVESVLLRQLAQLSSEDFYSTESRLERAAQTLPDLTEALAPLHVVPETILIRAVRFQSGYENRLQVKQLTRQKTLLATAQQKVEVELQKTGTKEKEIEAAEKEARGTWDKELQQKSSDNEVAIASITGDANKEDQEVRSNADADYETMIAEGKLLIDKAEALRNELRNKALDTTGGSIFLAQRAAQNLTIESVTLNSNDPDVPTIIDIPGLVKLLVGSKEGE